jgi:hypothetical protein
VVCAAFDDSVVLTEAEGDQLNEWWRTTAAAARALSVSRALLLVAELQLSEAKRLKELDLSQAPEWQCVWRGSRDGFDMERLQSALKGRGESFMVCRTDEAHVFGGFVPVERDLSGRCSDPFRRSFIFTLRNTAGVAPCIFTAGDPDMIIICRADALVWGVGTGHGGRDLCIRFAYKSFSDLGRRYQRAAAAVAAGEGKATRKDMRELLAGAFTFTVTEIEMFVQR